MTLAETSLRILASGMRYTRSILLFIYLLLPVLCKALPGYLFNKSFAERYKQIDSLRLHMIYNIDNAETSKKKLNEWISAAEKENDEALVYQLKFSSIYLKQHSNPVAEERKILQQIKAAVSNGFTLEAADGYYILSGWINHSGRRAKAMEYALLGYELCKDETVKDYPPKVKTVYRLAEWYYSYKEYRKTINILLSLSDVEEQPLQNIVTGGELNTLALAYRELGQLDSAVYYFKQIYEDGLHKVPVSVRGIAAGNLGSIYQRQQDYQNALLWFKHELQLWRIETGDTKSLSCFSSYLGIADIYYSLGQMPAARTYFDSAARNRNGHHSYNALSRYYKMYTKLLKAEGNYRMALLYTDSFLYAREAMLNEANVSQLLATEKRVAASKHQLELAHLNNLREKSIWIRNFAILLIAFIAVVAILLINRNRLKHKQRELALEHEKTKAEARLVSFTSKMQEKNLQLVQLKEELAELNNEQDIAKKNELIRQLQQSTILTDEQWEDFRNVFEQVHGGFIQRIKDKYPEITPGEMHYIVLVKLNMTNKEIANVLGIGANSVRNYKFRLRKKFNLTENDDLEMLIRSF